MLFAVKGNREYPIDENQKDEYEQEGYIVFKQDEDGLKKLTEDKVSEETQTLKEELSKKDEEISALKDEIDSLKEELSKKDGIKVNSKTSLDDLKTVAIEFGIEFEEDVKKADLLEAIKKVQE